MQRKHTIQYYAARRGNSWLWSQHFGRLRRANHEVRSLRAFWPRWWNPVSTKNIKISQAWWCMFVIPATMGGWGRRITWTWRQGLQWAEIIPLHSRLATERDSVSKKKKEVEHDWSPNSGCILPNQCIVGQSAQLLHVYHPSRTDPEKWTGSQVGERSIASGDPSPF